MKFIHIQKFGFVLSCAVFLSVTMPLCTQATEISTTVDTTIDTTTQSKSASQTSTEASSSSETTESSAASSETPTVPESLPPDMNDRTEEAELPSIIPESHPVESTPSKQETNSSTSAKEDFKVSDASGAYYISASDGLNVRSGPSTSYDVIGSLAYGAKIRVTGLTDNDWYRIDYDKKAGYISAEYVTDQPISQTSNSSTSNDSENTEESLSSEVASEDSTVEAVENVVSKLKAVVLLFIIGAVIISIIVTGIVFMKKEHEIDEAVDNDEDNNSFSQDEPYDEDSEYDEEYDDDEYYDDSEYSEDDLSFEYPDDELDDDE